MPRRKNKSRKATSQAAPKCNPPVPEAASLGSTVAADLNALKTDLEEARLLSATYQAEIAGKDNELARLTELFEKTRRHLIQLQLNVTSLRDERHRLANGAMEADALERKLEAVTAERDRLRQQLLSRDIWHG
jgi:chromosome segregation ATPase